MIGPLYNHLPVSVPKGSTKDLKLKDPFSALEDIRPFKFPVLNGTGKISFRTRFCSDFKLSELSCSFYAIPKYFSSRLNFTPSLFSQNQSILKFSNEKLKKWHS